jgi:predicted Rossmann fold nucleotide-binding protein DprA/Smf involved in DNA uptake
MKKIAVIGGRDFNNYEIMEATLKQFEIDEIVSGGAKGADSLAETYAKNNNIPFKLFEAEWDNLEATPCLIRTKDGKKYNALAGFNRNKLLVDHSDYVIAFWDGKSKGTKDSIDYAKKTNKDVLTIKYYN